MGRKWLMGIFASYFVCNFFNEVNNYNKESSRLWTNTISLRYLLDIFIIGLLLTLSKCWRTIYMLCDPLYINILQNIKRGFDFDYTNNKITKYVLNIQEKFIPRNSCWLSTVALYRDDDDVMKSARKLRGIPYNHI